MTPRLRTARLVGERVELVPLEPSFAPRAFSMLHENDAILRWLVWDGPERLEDLEAFYCRWCVPGDDGDDYHLAILERPTGAFAGCIGPRFAGHPGRGDVGYWLGPEFWGRGLMTEAVRLVDHLCFRHLGADVMTADVFVGNHGSRRVLERNGYTLVHTSRGRVRKRGRSVEEWAFALLRADFERAFEGYRPVEESVELERARTA